MKIVNGMEGILTRLAAPASDRAHCGVMGMLARVVRYAYERRLQCRNKLRSAKVSCSNR